MLGKHNLRKKRHLLNRSQNRYEDTAYLYYTVTCEDCGKLVDYSSVNIADLTRERLPISLWLR